MNQSGGCKNVEQWMTETCALVDSFQEMGGAVCCGFVCLQFSSLHSIFMNGPQETRPEVTIDASVSPCCWLTCLPFSCGAFPYKTELQLGAEEVARVDVDLCGQHVSRRPYGELGSVDRGNCLCCVSVVSSFGEISPGCGCESNTVDQIVMELNKRMRDRGDTAQIQRAEQTIRRLDVVESKLDLIMDHLNIPKPEKEMDRL